MSWNDFHQRRDIADSVLRKAASNPEGPLPFAEVRGAEQAFGTEEQLLLYLHYRWAQLVSGYLRAELSDETESVDGTRNAWRKAVARHRDLHEVLDANIGRYESLRRVHETQLRTLAVSAGLADPGEPLDEITRIGSAFVALIDERGKPKARNGLSGLLRMLAPTA
ncbi:hypothetical protein FPZ12_032235 [Amycolatopsis acidicola]|uniref:TetR/AcrR family transcriptional regulator n=1 Tax=Amycolatopsis acidicola TaxID=2596893 RepID=A0A5N0UV73_9PSEU|nr:hypothetical protein [Amycolatopsis acidicola]KAA9154432.1 hypothetical protein FPZ12_032235 [Amycolatopsis acidicola]